MPSKRKQDIWTDAYEREEAFVVTYLDEKPFKQYTEKISKIISAADHALCTREIHEALGNEARREWTADALEAILNIEPVGVQPVRYRPKNRRELPLFQPQKETTSHLFA